MFWLSKEAGDNNIGPTNLERLAHQLNRHMKAVTAANEDTPVGNQPIAIIEGLEYLVSNNDFNKVLRFIEALHEKALLNRAIGILPINPSAMDRRELEMLEREMDMCLTYQPGRPVSITGGVVGEASKDEEPEEESPSLAAFKNSLKTASEQKLRNACRKLGLSKKGSREELYNRIIKFVDENKPPIRMKDFDEPAAAQPGEETRKIKEIEGQYRQLEKEREKLRTEHEKLLKEKLKHTHELEMTKLKRERSELMTIKKELTEREKKLLTKEKEFDKRVMDLEERFDELDVSPPGDEFPSRTDFDEHSKQVDTGKKTKVKPIGPPTVLPRIQHDDLLQSIDRYIDKSILGKKKEEVTSIQPAFLQLLKTRIRIPRGRFRKKDREYDLLWDTVSGELVIDYRNGLRRTEGLERFYKLSQPQIKILLAMGSLRAHEPHELMKETGLAKSHTTRALNKLTDMGLIERKFDSSGKNEKFKRVYKMKIPTHPEKEKVVLPEQVQRENKEMVLPSTYYQKQIEKLLESMMPGVRVVKSENIYYPFFMVDILGRSREPRKLLIDAVTGKEDKVLSKALT